MTILIDQEIIRLKRFESYGTQTTPRSPKKAPINSKHYSKELLGTPKNSRVYSKELHYVDKVLLLRSSKKMRSLGMKGKPNDPKILKKINVS